MQKKNHSFYKQKGETNTILVILLVVASFLIGSLWTRTQFMEKAKNSDTAAVGNVAGATDSPKEAPAAAAKTPKITAEDHITGDKNANIVLVEYSDMECPFCKNFHETMLKVMEEYKGKVAWIYRHYPLNFHANAQKEAEASECANELGGNDAFWKYTNAIYGRTTSNGTGFALDNLVPLAEEIGLNGAKFKECLDSGKYTKKITDEMALGQAEGVSGTPGTIILNKKTGKTVMIPGALPFEEVKKLIDPLL